MQLYAAWHIHCIKGAVPTRLQGQRRGPYRDGGNGRRTTKSLSNFPPQILGGLKENVYLCQQKSETYGYN
jgi:hypothetical protein